MARRSWLFNLDGRQHTVVLEHNYWTTRQVICVDGSVIVDKTPLHNLADEHCFMLAEHICCVSVGRRYLAFGVKYTLTLDGNVIAP